MRFKSVAEFLDPKNGHHPTTAERDLIQAVQSGQDCWLCDRKAPTLPAAATDKTRIRGDLLRLLITGGSKDCGLHERGVHLNGGWVEGELTLAFCTGKGRTALDFCHFQKKPDFSNCKVPELSLQDCRLSGLIAQGVQVRGSLFLNRTTSTDTIDVNSAKVGGQLVFNDTILNGRGSVALNAQRVQVADSVFFTRAKVAGTVNLNSAKIGGQLAFVGTQLDGKDDEAINLESASISDILLLRDATVFGTIDAKRARIGGQLIAKDSTFDGRGGKALEADHLITGDSLLLRDVHATGCVAFPGASIEGQLVLNRSKFIGGGKTALYAEGVDIRHSLIIDGTDVTGSASFPKANIDGSMEINDVDLDGLDDVALNAHGMKVKGDLLIRSVRRISGRVQLSSAHVRSLVDTPSILPALPNSLILDGFSYDAIGTAAPVTFAARRKWLEVGSNWQGEFRPQPYTQLAKVLRQMGHAGEARKVLIERERLLAHHRLTADRAEYQAALHGNAMERGDAGWIWLRMRGLQVWTWLTRIVAGYGYAPQRALYCALVIVPLFALLYFLFWRLGAMVPADAILLVSPEWAEAVAAKPSAPSHVWQGPAQKHYETFYSLPYALDVFLPVVDLGQQSTWSQTTETWTGWAARLTTWALQTLGYVVTSLGLAAATGIIQRNQPD